MENINENMENMNEKLITDLELVLLNRVLLMNELKNFEKAFVKLYFQLYYSKYTKI